jgi:hypothetical protein
MLVPPFVKENKEIIAAVTGGTLAIIAAYIRRDKAPVRHARRRPIRNALLLSLLGLALGAACLAAEALFFPINPDVDDLSTENLGEILCLAGCVFVAAGIIWGVINVFRLVLWTKPEDAVAVLDDDVPTPATVPLSRKGKHHDED